MQAFFGYPGMSAYSAAKAGVLGLTRQLAVEYGPVGVRVNAVLPTLVLNERNRASWTTTPGLLDRHAELFPLRRVGEPADVARAVAFPRLRGRPFHHGSRAARRRRHVRPAGDGRPVEAGTGRPRPGPPLTSRPWCRAGCRTG
ncbi:SDR family NAD(P)-dependent oxidoreductase [Streptomyces sp. NPDC057301]|uniref:SDR family NAD(P)-dependent oxidoreductase n=1 Tax=Streptomyces sp. NPDC057301 TaxID=3346093 RepID=UPI00363F3F42